jgi:hypothetical protein
MPDHKCPKCKKRFGQKGHLEYHVTNNACKEYSHYCDLCGKGFTTASSMHRHINSNCAVKKENDNNNNEILNRLIQMEAEMKLTNKKMKMLEKDNKKVKKLELTVEKLSNENKKIKKVNKTIQTNSNNNNNNSINNGTVINAAITLVGYGNEDMSKIDKAEILKVLQSGFNSTLKLTEAVHFNPKYPEGQNIYISNMKDKYAMMYDGEKWTLTTKDELINTIYEDKKDYIENNLEHFIDSLTPFRINALKRWLDTDDNDKNVKNIKENIKLLLYNSRNIPMKCLETNTNSTNRKHLKYVESSNESDQDNNDVTDSNNESGNDSDQSEEIIKVNKPSTKKIPVTVSVKTPVNTLSTIKVRKACPHK